jgi:membrane-bound lytic murein transglycosylase B
LTKIAKIYLMLGFLLMSLLGCANTNNSSVWANSANQQKWRQWVNNLRIEALAQGIRADLFERVFKDVTPQVGLIILDKRQTKGKGNFYYYRKKRGDAFRIRLGRSEYLAHKVLLERIAKQYKVDPCFITAIWGIETVYGRYTGHYPVIASLATLAYDSRRSEFFRQELLYALQIINGGHVQENNFNGAWDGGMGQPQFMPSSWYKFAVDYDGDGRKDIWYTYGDIFASIANYLTKNGWQNGQPYSVEISLPARFDERLLDMSTTKTVAQWQALGVKIKRGQSLPVSNLSASVKQLDGGPAIMVFNNFKVILTYNNSSFYAGTVGYLANNICRGRQ